jgi:hypothetical protein
VEFFAQRLEPIDISLGGLRIYSDQDYRVGEFLRLDIFFPPAQHVTFAAEVMWTKTLGKGAPARFDLGLAFVELHPDALKVLLSALGSAGEVDGSPESEPAGEPVPSSIEVASDERNSEVRPVTAGPATVREGRAARSLLSKIPVVAVDAHKLRSEPLDPRAGLLVSLIDGVTTVGSLLDSSPMSVDETLSLLEDLRLRGIVDLL